MTTREVRGAVEQEVCLLLPGLVTDSLNRDLRAHWAVKRRRSETWAATLLGLYGRGRAARRQARLTITSYRRRQIADHDNFVGGLKPLIDVLVRLGWLVDDSGAWLVHGAHRQEHDWESPRTKVEIAYLT
jgi:hypothetical protein